MPETNVVFADVPIRNCDGELQVSEETIHGGEVDLPIVEWRFTLGVRSDNVDPRKLQYQVVEVELDRDNSCAQAPEFPFRLSGDPSAEEAQKRLQAVWFDFEENVFRLRPKASAFPSTCDCEIHKYELQIAVRWNEAAGKNDDHDNHHAADPHVIFHGGDRWRRGDPDV